jgi:beta-barrel assembly-enhancing protease
MRLRFCSFFLAVVFFSPRSFPQTLVAASIDTGASSDSPASAEILRTYHDSSVRDIGAIGARNVGCGRGMGNWYTLERQIDMGKDYSAHVEASSRLITDSEITKYIDRIGQNLVRNSDSLFPFTIKVVDSDDVNAFALPGGFFYVDSGLILAADNEAELAGVMAHEIAHVAACHAARQRTRGKLMNMASIPLMMIGGPVGFAGYEALTIAKPISYLRYSRQFESDADYLGVQYMYKAGYDPEALTTFFEKVKAREKNKDGAIAKAFRTHPQTPERIEKTQIEISTLLPARPEYTVDTSDFQDVKARLQALQNPRRINRGTGRGPTLRRSPHTESDKLPDGVGDERVPVH